MPTPGCTKTPDALSGVTSALRKEPQGTRACVCLQDPLTEKASSQPHRRPSPGLRGAPTPEAAARAPRSGHAPLPIPSSDMGKPRHRAGCGRVSSRKKVLLICDQQAGQLTGRRDTERGRGSHAHSPQRSSHRAGPELGGCQETPQPLPARSQSGRHRHRAQSTSTMPGATHAPVPSPQPRGHTLHRGTGDTGPRDIPGGDTGDQE